MLNFLKRFKEPSTWAGLAAIAVAFGVKPEQAGAALDVVNAVTTAAAGTNHVVIGQVVTAVCGAIAVFLPEAKPKAAVQ